MFKNTLVRTRGSKTSGNSFTESEIQAVWMKGKIIPEENPNFFRRDPCGALIERNQYGKLSSTGWEVDHIRPASRGGGDELYNLQPLQWENNRSKGDDYPQYRCAVKY